MALKDLSFKALNTKVEYKLFLLNKVNLHKQKSLKNNQNGMNRKGPKVV